MLNYITSCYTGEKPVISGPSLVTSVYDASVDNYVQYPGGGWDEFGQGSFYKGTLKRKPPGAYMPAEYAGVPLIVTGQPDEGIDFTGVVEGITAFVSLDGKELKRVTGPGLPLDFITLRCGAELPAYPCRLYLMCNRFTTAYGNGNTFYLDKITIYSRAIS